jgi:hypothetical protein
MFISAHIFEMLTEYFLFFDSKELAKVCAIQAVRSVQELVSHVTLPEQLGCWKNNITSQVNSVFYA